MVPISYWVITTIGVPSVTAIRIAFGTSLLVILPTVISGTWFHSRRKAIHWRAAIILGLCGLAGALLGATLASYLPVDVLEKGFGGLILAAAIWMGLGIKVTAEEKRPRENLLLLASCGFPIGVISGLTGLGGGAFIVPTLLLAFHFPMHIAIGTSVASIVFMSLGGVIGYIVNGIQVSDLLPYSIGYVNLPIWVCLATTSIPLAQLGTRAAHALPARQLMYVFVAFMVYVGLKMLGVF